MVRFVKGDVVVVPFPFSDLTQAKRRPALVLAQLRGNDRILCQITSQHVRDPYAIELTDSDFEAGSLKQRSNIRPSRIFTCDTGIILYRVGQIKADKNTQMLSEA
jgi:mRNA interferase MazF